MAEHRFSDAELDAAVEALEQPERFREAESVVTSAAPKLQRILMQALEAGGWFGESHDNEVLKAATNPNDEERLTAVRTLLAEEARMGMMVGVAVGWALAEELRPGDGKPDTTSATGGD
ncbi:MAG: hypothetical protein ACR2N5_04305 [Solirubrobacterales bacterium]